MGIYTVDCIECKKPFQWWSGVKLQLCNECRRSCPSMGEIVNTIKDSKITVSDNVKDNKIHILGKYEAVEITPTEIPPEGIRFDSTVEVDTCEGEMLEVTENPNKIEVKWTLSKKCKDDLELAVISLFVGIFIGFMIGLMYV